MYQGGCLCGRIRFSAASEAKWPHLCSCEHCQKLSGSPAMAWVGFPSASFAWTGGTEPTWFETFPGIGRGFCPVCGSTVASRGDEPGEVGVTMMSLDDAGDLVPVHQSFQAHAVSWMPPIATLDGGS